MTADRGQIIGGSDAAKTIWLTEYRCIWLICEIANEAMKPDYVPHRLRPNLPITAELKTQVLGELQKIVRDQLIPFGEELQKIVRDQVISFWPQKVRERELVANRIKFDGRLDNLKGSGVLAIQKNKRLCLEFDWQPLIEDAETLVDYGLALILDTRRPNSETPWITRIHQCAYGPCSKYFIRVNTLGAGRPTTTCSPEHKKNHARVIGRLRMRKKRAEDRQKGKTKKTGLSRRKK